MRLHMYHVDAFTNKLFRGNPAAVCPLDQWLPVDLMQKIAMENNLAETAYYVSGPKRHEIRWFTPAVEVDLCGHATLASAFVLFNFGGYQGSVIEFDSRSGLLSVQRDGNLLTLDFPADPPSPVDAPEQLIRALETQPLQAYKGKTDYMFVFREQREIEEMAPDMGLLANISARGIIVTAPGREVDFVSRFFAPGVGVSEDPVTGSAHTTLTPYWAARLGKTDLTAMQLSKRQGWLWCSLDGNRVKISGHARAYLEGWIEVE